MENKMDRRQNKRDESTNKQETRQQQAPTSTKTEVFYNLEQIIRSKVFIKISEIDILDNKIFAFEKFYR